jgi:hypothetical protein
MQNKNRTSVEDTHSSPAPFRALKMVIADAAIYKRKTYQFDVSGAFYQAIT